MLQNEAPLRARTVTGGGTIGIEPTLELASLRRHFWSVAVVIAASLALALVYLILRTPTYTATARLLVDNRMLQMTPENSVFTASAAATNLAAPHVLSQIEVLRSRRVAARAVAELERQGAGMVPRATPLLDRLLDRTDAAAATVPWLGPTGTDALRSILVGLGGRPSASREAEALIDRKIAQLQSGLTVSRIGDTFAIDVRSRNEDPEFAARMTNAVVTSYLQDLAEANERSARGASAWLRDAVKEAGPSARIISDATPPVNRDGPRVLHVLAAALIGGGLAGVATAFARDLLDRRIWRPEQIVALTGAECFGALPRIEGLWAKSGRRADGGAPSMEGNTWLGLSDLDEAYKWSILYPGSGLAHIMERIHVTATIENRHIKTLGLTATGVREGTSLVALNLALSAAMGGRKVLLVDASGTKAGLSALLAPNAEYSVSDVLDGVADISVAVCRDPLTGLQFLPAGWDRICMRPDLVTVFDRFDKTYDLIVFDLPALVPRPDVRAVTSRLDAFLLVVEAGNLQRDEIARRLEVSGMMRDRLLGSVLNKSDPRRLRA